MTNFQLGLMIVFGVFLIAGVLIFSGLVPGLKTSGNQNVVGGQVTVWGTLPSSVMNPLLEDLKRVNKPLEVIYTEKNPATFDRELTESLASGVGPDVIMLPDNLIYRHADKVMLIPYTSVTERNFKNTFVQEGELYMTSAGIIALPFTLDPMVMYWNRDLFNNAGISQPPKTWEEIMASVSKLTIKDSSQNVTQASVSLGEFRNVSYAKDIIALLTIQAGNPITARGAGGFSSVFSEGEGFSLKPAEEAIRYYTGFSNSVSPIYSWNKSLPISREYFLSGQLAMYFGYASEIFGLRSQNPHLNFDVTRMPQVKGSKTATTIGRMNGLALMKVSKNPAAAAGAIMLLTGADFEAKLAQKILLPPPRRDLLAVKPTDAYMNVFFDSALAAKSWIDPNPSGTASVFNELVSNVGSGRLGITEAVMNASSEINSLFSR